MGRAMHIRWGLTNPLRNQGHQRAFPRFPRMAEIPVNSLELEERRRRFMVSEALGTFSKPCFAAAFIEGVVLSFLFCMVWAPGEEAQRLSPGATDGLAQRNDLLGLVSLCVALCRRFAPKSTEGASRHEMPTQRVTARLRGCPSRRPLGGPFPGRLG